MPSTILAVLFLAAPALICAQTTLLPNAPLFPNAPSYLLIHTAASDPGLQPAPQEISSSLTPAEAGPWTVYPAGYAPQDSPQTTVQAKPTTPRQDPRQTDGPPNPNMEYDKDGNPIPLSRRQPKRILGFMPNFRSVSAGAIVPRPGWKYDFKIATRQSFDYSSFVFLGLTTATAYAQDSHPSLDTYNGGNFPFYGYLWRGMVDKTDGTYIGAWFLPALLHEDTRYFPLGEGHRIVTRAFYVISRQGVARTYSGRNTPNIAGLGGKVLTQFISRYYYPPGSSDFSVLATKFAYASMRDIGFSAIREFYPDSAAHFVRVHREKQARLAAAADARAAGVPQ